MERDFATDEDIYLVLNNKRYDLHGDYLFSRLAYDASARSVTLTWDGKQGNSRVVITFEEVSLLKLREADTAYPKREARYTSFVGFLNIDDIEVMDGFLPDDGNPTVHFIAGFQDASAIKVGAERASLSAS